MKICRYLGVAACCLIIILFAVVATIAAIELIGHLLTGDRNPAYYKFCLDLFKIVSVGLILGALGILIPAFVAYSRDRFERLKDSRVAYSNAKTSLDYLSLRLSAANIREASRLIQEAHFHKHQAQLYDHDFDRHLKNRYDNPPSPKAWDEEMYHRLRNTRLLLKQYADEWNRFSPARRLQLLASVLVDADETSKSYEPFATEKQIRAQQRVNTSGSETDRLGDKFARQAK